MDGETRRDVRAFVGARIRSLREDCGMAVETLSELSDIPVRTPVEKSSTWRRKMSAPAPQDVVAPLPPVKSVSAVSCDRSRAAGGALTPAA